MEQINPNYPKRPLGHTGLQATVMGLGCGGHSRLGMSQGATFESAVDIVRTALKIGINFIDTAESYGTEAAVGEALSEFDRSQVIVSTKVPVHGENGPIQADEFRRRVDACLSRLRSNYVDILHLHGVSSDHYEHALKVLQPVMRRLKDEGIVHHIGITEQFIVDTKHQMLSGALDDGWEVVMVGHNILNQSARSRVLARTAQLGIGALCMFAIRRALSQPDELRRVMAELREQGLLDGDYDEEDPLAFAVRDSDASTLQEAAYRFCGHEPGLDVILSGTGKSDHLKANAEHLKKGPLPEAVTTRLRSLFERVDCVSGN